MRVLFVSYAVGLGVGIRYDCCVSRVPHRSLSRCWDCSEW
jgi:hypothetical protein